MQVPLIFKSSLKEDEWMNGECTIECFTGYDYYIVLKDGTRLIAQDHELSIDGVIPLGTQEQVDDASSSQP